MQKEPLELLRDLCGELSTIYHDANNPLAIISGNAQFLQEMARAMALDEELTQPIEDIDEACQRVVEKLRDLVQIKEEVARYVAAHDAGDGTPEDGSST